jgi:hypothetical protein
MTGHDWFDRFVAAGPGYDGVRMSLAELQALLLKAGIGAGLPLGHAEDFSGLADLVILHRIDWPLLLWPMLSRAEQVYGMRFGLVSGAKGSVTVEIAEQAMLDAFGEAQPVPVEILEKLKGLAARTYVPASEASRAAGAGAGLSDND